MINKTFILSAVLICALFFSGWLIQQMNNNAMNATVNPPDTPDTFMEKATYVKLDQNGNLHSKIYVSKMKHYPSNDTSYFTTPRVIFYNQNHVPWDITANEGKSQSGVSQVFLWDNVKIHQPAGPNSHELTMTTTNLTIFPEKQFAQTDQPVTIIEPGSVINSVGLRANLNTGEVQLLSHARGVYEATN